MKLPQPSQLSDYICVLQENLTAEAERFWCNLLQGSSVNRILLHSKTACQNVFNDRVVDSVPHASLQSFGIIYATFVKVACSFILVELSPKSEVVFGHVMSRRNLPLNGVNEVVGQCINSVPVRIRLEQAATILDLMNQIQDQ